MLTFVFSNVNDKISLVSMDSLTLGNFIELLGILNDLLSIEDWLIYTITNIVFLILNSILILNFFKKFTKTNFFKKFKLNLG
jgi:hypothetical protein